MENQRKSERLLRRERHKLIIDYVTENKVVSVHDLCREFYMSE